MPHFIDDWRADHYRWQNNGVAALPKKNPVVSKSYFALDTEDGLSNEFKWYAYQKVGKSNDTTIIITLVMKQ